MLRERVHPGGWVTLGSPKLEAIGVPHGFTTTVGPGAERWSVRTADDLRAFRSESGFGHRRIAMGRQVHGATVTTPEGRDASGCDDADAHITHQPDELVAVRTADCVPLLLARADGSVVAAVHAGWRGLEAGVIAEAVRVLASGAGRVAEPASFVAAIGPCIGVAAYEVGEEVAERFEHGVVRRPDWPKPHLDLRAITLRRLLDAGLEPDGIDVATECTFGEADRFGSFRRDGKGCGHQAAYIGTIGS